MRKIHFTHGNNFSPSRINSKPGSGAARDNGISAAGYFSARSSLILAVIAASSPEPTLMS